MWFIDSIKFMNSSLSKLVENLSKKDMELAERLYAMNRIKADDKYSFEDKVSILSQKNVFPYVWF